MSAAGSSTTAKKGILKGSITVKSTKKQVTREPESENEMSEDDQDSDLNNSDQDMGSENESKNGSESDEDEIRQLADGKAPVVKKVKNPTLKPTAAPNFSNALTHLLSLPSTTSSLAPTHNVPSAKTARLERQARSLIRESRASHLSKGHVRDVIAGWTPRPNLPFSLWDSESARNFAKARDGGIEGTGETGAEREKHLRRVAQRGVVKLFNAIAAAQGVTKEAAAEKRPREIEQNPTEEPASKVRKPNILGGRGKAETLSSLSKASFLDLIRQGTTTA